MPVGACKIENIKTACLEIEKAAKSGAQIAVLPEMFCCPYSTACFNDYGEEVGGEAQTAISEAAAKNGLYVVAGSIPEKCGQRIYNTAYVYSPEGSTIAKHRKVHLFDIDIAGGQRFKESDVLSPGEGVTVFDTVFGKIGLIICFDLRFPEMIAEAAQKGVFAVIIPASFNMSTGPDHWELLLRARAVDFQVYTAAVGCARDLTASYVSYAHSMVCDPWGRVIYDAGTGFVTDMVYIDAALNESIRKQMPLGR